MNPIPKSLHTVRVVVRVAAEFWRRREALTLNDAVDQALRLLDYDPQTPDPHRLRAQAVKQLGAQQP